MGAIHSSVSPPTTSFHACGFSAYKRFLPFLMGKNPFLLAQKPPASLYMPHDSLLDTCSLGKASFRYQKGTQLETARHRPHPDSGRTAKGTGLDLKLVAGEAAFQKVNFNPEFKTCQLSGSLILIFTKTKTLCT